SFIVLAVVACTGTGCSKLSVEWTPRPGEVEVTARGFTNANLLVLAGRPATPLLQRDTPSIWWTVGPSKEGAAGEVVRVPFGDDGVARVAIPQSRLPGDGRTLVQALVQARSDGAPLAVSGCQALSWQDGRPTIRPHAI